MTRSTLHAMLRTSCAVAITLVLSADRAPSLSAQSVATATLTIEITDVAHGRGDLHVSLYDDAGDFLHVDDAFTTVIVPAEAGTVTATLPRVPTGTYAVAVFHDEDGDGELDTNLFHVPTEGVGISNDARARFGPPRYRDAAFDVTGDARVSVQTRY